MRDRSFSTGQFHWEIEDGRAQLHGIHDRFAFLFWPRFALRSSTSRLFFLPDSSALQLCMNELRGIL